jgi:hypothetical protein
VSALQLEYTLTEEEFLNYNYYVGWDGPAQKQKRIKFYIGFPLLFVLLTIVLFSDMDISNPKLSSIIIIVTGFVILLLLMKFGLRGVFDKQAKKMLEQSGRDAVLSKTTITVDENGLFGKTKVAEVKYAWNAFQRKEIANNCYYLFINSRQAAVIPFSAFQSPAEKEKFDALLLQYLPLKAELKQFT